MHGIMHLDPPLHLGLHSPIILVSKAYSGFKYFISASISVTNISQILPAKPHHAKHQ
jgi:hypothetical protein